ncbi:MAG: hypothetical protein SGARI_002595 [Bacillariaceae sp.]
MELHLYTVWIGQRQPQRKFLVSVVKRQYKEWFPVRFQANPMQALLLNSSSRCDVVFVLGDGDGVRAHSCVLEFSCPMLFELIKQTESSQTKEKEQETRVNISGIATGVFRSLLGYAYTACEPEFVSEAFTMSVLGAANRFNMIDLKLLCESVLTYKFLCIDNAADLLVFADSNCCPLLREAALKLGAAHRSEFAESDGFESVRKSADLLAEVFTTTVPANDSEKDTKDPEKMSVLALREKLEEYKLDLDGTRAMLVERLKEHDGTPAKKARHKDDA